MLDIKGDLITLPMARVRKLEGIDGDDITTTFLEIACPPKAHCRSTFTNDGIVYGASLNCPSRCLHRTSTTARQQNWSISQAEHHRSKGRHQYRARDRRIEPERRQDNPSPLSGDLHGCAARHSGDESSGVQRRKENEVPIFPDSTVLTRVVG